MPNQLAGPAPNSGSHVARTDFSFIRYGAVWEDADILCKALSPVAKGKRLLSIASAGDNVLALLTLNPKEIVAADLNQAQLACLDLRIAAFQALPYSHVLSFLGVTANAGRLGDYEKLRRRLSPWAQEFWDKRPKLLRSGVLHAGKLERYMRFFQWCLHRFVHPPDRIEELLGEMSRTDREQYHEEVWNTKAWRLLNRLLFSRKIYGRLGRDPGFFRHAGDDVSSIPERRLAGVLSSHPAHENPYLSYYLTGNYSPSALPLYLREKHFKAIRSRIGRVREFAGPVEHAPGQFSGFNLSNIFEYMDTEGFERTYGDLIKMALPGARLAYWNLHVERSCPDSARAWAQPLPSLASKLHAIDKSWIYRAFHVDQRKGPRQRNQ